jgi:hypothetical protein
MPQVGYWICVIMMTYMHVRGRFQRCKCADVWTWVLALVSSWRLIDGNQYLICPFGKAEPSVHTSRAGLDDDNNPGAWASKFR